MGRSPAVIIALLGTGSAHPANVVIPVIMPTIPAILAVIITGMYMGTSQAARKYDAKH